MKLLIVIFLLIFLVSCANLTYKSADGIEVTYTRFLTSADLVKGQIGDAFIEMEGQNNNIDAQTFGNVIKILTLMNVK